MGKTSSAVKNRYNAKVYDNVQIRPPKGTKDRWKAAAGRAGVSMQRFIIDAVEAAVARLDGK